MFTTACRQGGSAQILKCSISGTFQRLHRRWSRMPFSVQAARRQQSQSQYESNYTPSSPKHPPLRILYCGSDHFSATSLIALHQEHLADNNFIKSIDVVTRTPKAVNRGLRSLSQVPIKRVAAELGLRTYEIDTFTGWEPPDNSLADPINLIVAVSFGKFIPRRLLDQCLYGGINVHPSLLPMYRGPAPIYHALLNNDPFTGVTVQTLSPVAFDHGAILAQSPELPIPPGTSYSDLHDFLAVTSAQLLIHTCRTRLFAPPIKPIISPYKPSTAPKLTTEETYYIDWAQKSAKEVERYCGVLGNLWGRFGDKEMLARRRRVIFSHIEEWKGGEEWESREDEMPGSWHYLMTQEGPGILLVKCKSGGGWVRVGGVKMEGKHLRDGGEWARSMVMSGKANLRFT